MHSRILHLQQIKLRMMGRDRIPSDRRAGAMAMDALMLNRHPQRRALFESIRSLQPIPSSETPCSDSEATQAQLTTLLSQPNLPPDQTRFLAAALQTFGQELMNQNLIMREDLPTTLLWAKHLIQNLLNPNPQYQPAVIVTVDSDKMLEMGQPMTRELLLPLVSLLSLLVPQQSLAEKKLQSN